MENRLLEPSAARLVESLRDTGYTFVTSVADILDNSVAAGANKIAIKLEVEFTGQPTLLIADNGTGMDSEELVAAMTYGSPKRPSPKSLGKFGMGLKTASTSFCRKLTVISKKDGHYNTAQWDLDVVANSDKWLLQHPKTDEYEEAVSFLETIIGEGNGTIVIWENIDRLLRTNTEGMMRNQLSNIADELRQHLSGVFYNFLSDNAAYPDLAITINDKPLEGWDPFCRWLNADGEKRVEEHINKPIISTKEVDGKQEVVGSFNVNIYILPNKANLTNDEVEKTRYGLDNQGFHIFREGRMIFSGGWPNRLFVKEPHLNLLRIECSFDHELDEIFQIDIKKSRIDFPKELREILKRVIGPAKNEANRRYRTGHKKKNDESTGATADLHDNSSNAINKHLGENTSSSQIGSTDASKGEAQVTNKFGTSTIKIEFDQSTDRVVRTSESLQDAVLWMPGLVEGNKHAVFLNESHEFYKRFYMANQENTSLILAMDALLWSLAEAELCVFNDNIKRNLEDFRISVSRSLRTLSEELPDVDDSENED
ncbi:MAG: ATP-binding protein [Chryseobacterium sp.]|nr:MAG: ATP-binding protein [Chryseobacterium sp.]